MSEPLEIEVSNDDFPWDTQIFISHKFVKEDRKLASTLKSILRKKEIFGYIADKKKEYTLPIDEKIQNSIKESQFLIAVITNDSLQSASVNQEIGFALGFDVPVALMIERGLVPEGVFTKGRDVEEFTRENFPIHCENIVKYILEYIEENKNSKKIPKGEKEWLIENVYTGLYNSIMNVYERRSFLEEIPPNLWFELPHTSRLRAESEIRNVFEEYSSEREKWSAIYLEWSNDFGRQVKELAEVISPAFAQVGLLNPNGSIMFPKNQNIALNDWLEIFKIILLDPSINDLTTLIEKVLKLAHFRASWLEKGLLHINTTTDFFRNLIPLLPTFRETFKTEVTYEGLAKQRQVMVSSIEKVKSMLEEKLKGN